MIFTYILTIFFLFCNFCYASRIPERPSLDDANCFKIPVTDNLTATACSHRSYLFIKPLANVNLSDFSVSYNYLSNRYYASFKMQLRYAIIQNLITEMAEYSHTNRTNFVKFVKITQVRFLQKSKKFYKLRDEIQVNEEWVDVEDQDSVELKFSCTTQDIANNLYKEVNSPEKKLGQIIKETVEVEFNEVISGRTKTNMPLSFINSNLDKIIEIKRDRAIIDIFDGSKKDYSIELKRRIVPALGDDKKRLTVQDLPRIEEKKNWFLIHRRPDSDYNFNKTWEEYKRGFGNINNNFWFGLDNLHTLTRIFPKKTKIQLRMEFERKNGEQKVAIYNKFSIRKEMSEYLLTISDFDSANSTVENDALSHFSAYKFSSFDHGFENFCAAKQGGGWWYKYLCTQVNFNSKCMVWMDKSDCLKRARMYLVFV